LCVVQELIFRDSSSMMCTGYCSNLVWSACWWLRILLYTSNHIWLWCEG